MSTINACIAVSQGAPPQEGKHIRKKILGGDTDRLILFCLKSEFVTPEFEGDPIRQSFTVDQMDLNILPEHSWIELFEGEREAAVAFHNNVPALDPSRFYIGEYGAVLKKESRDKGGTP